MFAGGCSSSPSRKGTDNASANARPTVLFPLPETPMTITTRAPMRASSFDQFGPSLSLDRVVDAEPGQDEHDQRGNTGDDRERHDLEQAASAADGDPGDRPQAEHRA